MKKILLLIIISILGLGCIKEVEVKATILSHVVTSDMYGSVRYRTVVKTEDGHVEELTGLEYYSIPVGEKINITVFR